MKKRKSMWETMQFKEKKFDAEKEYLDKLEQIYDKAIRDILRE